MGAIPNGLSSFPLLTALLERRSRRFGAGFRLKADRALSELPFEAGDRPNAGGGHIMVHFVGRTVPSGDAMHLTTLFVVNDEGAWMLRCPQDFSRDQAPGLIELAKAGQLEELYERTRVRIADHRVDIPRALPYLAPFNTWSANVTGSTYFVPVAELTVLYINVLLSFFDEEWRFFFVDDHNGYQPAGVAKFGRSRSGHLHDDPQDGRVGTVTMMESWIREFGTVEIGGMVQSLGLMAGAIGVGGFPHFVGYPGAWPAALGFRMLEIPFSRTIGAPASDGPDHAIVATIAYCTFYARYYQADALTATLRGHEADWHRS